jgi:hypothetical protein
MRARTLVSVLVLNATGSTLVSAQDRSLAYMDVTLGASSLNRSGPFDGEYHYRSAPLALLAFGAQPDSTRSFLAAVHVGLLNVIPSGGDVCRFTPLGGCYQPYPLSGIVAVTVGGRPLTAPWRFVELTGGPAYIGHDEGGNSFGALAVARLGQAPGHFLAAGITLLGLVTTIDGNLVFAGGVGFSLRTW